MKTETWEQVFSRVMREAFDDPEAFLAKYATKPAVVPGGYSIHNRTEPRSSVRPHGGGS
jgi:hypothetical protein